MYVSLLKVWKVGIVRIWCFAGRGHVGCLQYRLMRGLGLFSIRWMVCFLLSVEWNGLVKSVCIHLYTVDVEIVNRVMKKSNNNWLTLRGHFRARMVLKCLGRNPWYLFFAIAKNQQLSFKPFWWTKICHFFWKALNWQILPIFTHITLIAQYCYITKLWSGFAMWCTDWIVDPSSTCTWNIWRAE